MGRIERVSYRTGFVKRLREAAHLPAITFGTADLPEDVLALVDAHLLDLGGTYGDLNVGGTPRLCLTFKGRLWQSPAARDREVVGEGGRQDTNRLHVQLSVPPTR